MKGLVVCSCVCEEYSRLPLTLAYFTALVTSWKGRSLKPCWERQSGATFFSCSSQFSHSWAEKLLWQLEQIPSRCVRVCLSVCVCLCVCVCVCVWYCLNVSLLFALHAREMYNGISVPLNLLLLLSLDPQQQSVQGKANNGQFPSVTAHNVGRLIPFITVAVLPPNPWQTTC